MIVLCRSQIQIADVRILLRRHLHCTLYNALNLGNEMNGGGVPNSLPPQAIELKWLALGQPHASSVVCSSGTFFSTDYVLNPDRNFCIPTGILNLGHFVDRRARYHSAIGYPRCIVEDYFILIV